MISCVGGWHGPVPAALEISELHPNMVLYCTSGVPECQVTQGSQAAEMPLAPQRAARPTRTQVRHFSALLSERRTRADSYEPNFFLCNAGRCHRHSLSATRVWKRNIHACTEICELMRMCPQ